MTRWQAWSRDFGFGKVEESNDSIDVGMRYAFDRFTGKDQNGVLWLNGEWDITGMTPDRRSPCVIHYRNRLDGHRIQVIVHSV